MLCAYAGYGGFFLLLCVLTGNGSFVCIYLSISLSIYLSITVHRVWRRFCWTHFHLRPSHPCCVSVYLSIYLRNIGYGGRFAELTPIVDPPIPANAYRPHYLHPGPASSSSLDYASKFLANLELQNNRPTTYPYQPSNARGGGMHHPGASASAYPAHTAAGLPGGAYIEEVIGDISPPRASAGERRLPRYRHDKRTGYTGLRDRW